MVLQQGSNTVTCPVASIIAHIAETPALSPTQPFMASKDGTPIPANLVNRLWSEELSRLWVSKGHYMLHSLCKPAATQAYKGGAEPLQIKDYGGWRSSAYKQYIYPHSNYHVNRIITSPLKTS